VSDHVLSDFNSEERIQLADIVERGAASVQMIAKEGVTAAMNAFNRRT
jgi:peptidyl-tRNA hydrolase